MTQLLVVSTGRTGTVAFAANFQDRYPAATALHEPAGSRLLRIAGNMYAAGKLTAKHASGVVRSTYGIRRWRYRDRVFIECNPHMCCLLPIVRDLYPDTIIVHMVRHPADFIRSYINHGAFSGLKGWAGHRIPYWFLRPEHLAGHGGAAWGELSPEEACAWRWSVLNRIIERDAEAWGAQYVRVRYEDLFSGQPDDWIRISEVCGLDPAVWKARFALRRMNASSPKPGSTAITGLSIDRSILQARCGDQMKEYGYSA